MSQYIKFRLSPGQQAPDGSTGIGLLKGDWIVWHGKEKTFNSVARKGTILSKDQIPKDKIEYANMTLEEEQEYQDIMDGKYDLLEYITEERTIND